MVKITRYFSVLKRTKAVDLNSEIWGRTIQYGTAEADRPDDPYLWQKIFRADLQAIEHWNGTAWVLAAIALPCTSTTRPTHPSVGTLVAETDTHLLRWWNGAAWETLIPKGELTDRPAANVAGAGAPWFSVDKHRLDFSDGTIWYSPTGNVSATGDRPAASAVKKGTIWLDDTTKGAAWSDGTTWSSLTASDTNLYGSGVDGALVLDGTNDYSALGISKTGSVYAMSRHLFATNITLNAGVTLEPRGYVINFRGTFTLNGTVRHNGQHATHWTIPGAGAVAGPLGRGADGVQGGQTSVGGAVNVVAATAGPSISDSWGGNGGATSPLGGAAPSTTGAAGGIATRPADQHSHDWIVPDALKPFGQNGGAAGASGGAFLGTEAYSGSSGGGGGHVHINGPRIIGTGRIEAMGGNGCAAVPVSPGNGPAGGGGGGGGGLVSICGREAPACTIDVSGGTGGAGTGGGPTGGNGATGTSRFTALG